MSAKPKYLVTSAAGQTGREVVRQLRAKHLPVRALVRREDQRSAALEAAGAEVLVGNQYALADMRRAMAGVQRAYHCAPTGPNALHFGSVFAIAANETRLEHAVMMGQWLAQPDHPSTYTRETWLNEQVLVLLPETTMTVINTGWFAGNYFMVLEPAAQLGILPMPLGDGSVKRDVGASSEAIAAVVVGALTDPASHAGKTYRPTGPDLLSPNDVADAMSRALGRKVRYMNISERLFLKAFAALKPPLYSEANLTQLRLYAEEYRRGAFAVGGPTDVVERVGGIAPEPFEATVARAVRSRPEVRRSWRNQLRAIANFARILVTPTPDMAAIVARHGFVELSDASFSVDNKHWLATHQRTNPSRLSAVAA